MGSHPVEQHARHVGEATLAWELVWEVGGTLTESPVWDPGTRRVFFAAYRAGGASSVLAYGVDSGSREMWELPDRVGSLGMCRSGRVVVALRRRVVLLDPGNGVLETLTDELDEPAGNWLNDGRPAPDGRFWVGSVDARRALLFEGGVVPDPNGALYRVGADGDLQRMASGYLTSNGLAFSPDGGTMYHADTAAGYCDAWQFAAETGEIVDRRRFAELAAAEGKPDGAAVDADGNYWSAGISAGCLNRFSPSGALLQRIDTPCAAPTMPCFAERSIYLTSHVGIHRDAVSDLASRPHNIAGLFRAVADVSGPLVGLFAD